MNVSPCPTQTTFETFLAGRSARRDALVAKNVGIIYKVINTHFARLVARVGEPEVFQEAYIAGLEAADRFDPAVNVKFGTYLYRFVWGRLQDYVKAHVKRGVRFLPAARNVRFVGLPRGTDDCGDTLPDHREQPDALEAADDLRQQSACHARVVDNLLALAGGTREKWIVSYYYGLADGRRRGYDDVAAAVGVRPEAVKSLIHRLREQIKDMGRRGELGVALADRVKHAPACECGCLDAETTAVPRPAIGPVLPFGPDIVAAIRALFGVEADIRPLAKYPGYAVTADGRVFSWLPTADSPLRVEEETPVVHNKAYQFSFRVEGGTRKAYLHRLVLEAFKPVADATGLKVRVLNGDKFDVRPANLEWGGRAKADVVGEGVTA